MAISDSQLDQFISEQTLVCIRRKEIDSRSLQAIPIRYSDNLLLVQYIYNFYVDGQLVLRRKDITSMESRATDRFQQSLLVNQGLINQIDFQFEADLTSFAELVRFQSVDTIVILERERLENSDFWIGRVVEASHRKIRLHEFSGAGKWADEVTEISEKEVTCCQLNTNYIRFYAEHFKRLGQ